MLPANYIDVEQQSPEWMEMRKGCVTGSMVKNVVAKLATIPSLSKKCMDGKHETCKAAHCNCTCHGERAFYQECRENYMVDIVTTRITGRMSDRYVSKAMEDGVEREPTAIAEYEVRQGVMTEPIGIVFHPDIQWYASSPDFLLGSDIVGEAKCPTASTHMRYILEYLDAKEKGLEYVPDEYLPQVKAHLACTGRPLCHFISFHPDFPENTQLLVSPYRRDKGAIEAQDAEVVKFLAEAAELEKRLREIKL